MHVGYVLRYIFFSPRPAKYLLSSCRPEQRAATLKIAAVGRRLKLFLLGFSSISQRTANEIKETTAVAPFIIAGDGTLEVHCRITSRWNFPNCFP